MGATEELTTQQKLIQKNWWRNGKLLWKRSNRTLKGEKEANALSNNGKQRTKTQIETKKKLYISTNNNRIHSDDWQHQQMLKEMEQESENEREWKNTQQKWESN